MEKKTWLKTILFERGVTQEVLAEKAKVPRAYLSQYIHGRYILDKDQEKRIADVLEVPIGDVFINKNIKKENISIDMFHNK